MSSNRTILLIGAGVLALVIVSVMVVLLVPRQPASFPAGSAQAALQDYLEAWDRGDYERDYGFLSGSVRQDVTLPDYLVAARKYGSGRSPSRRVSIDRVSGSADRVTVELSVDEFSGDGLSANVSRSSRSVAMVHEAAGWKIDDPLIWLDPGPFAQTRP